MAPLRSAVRVSGWWDLPADWSVKCAVLWRRSWRKPGEIPRGRCPRKTSVEETPARCERWSRWKQSIYIPSLPGRARWSRCADKSETPPELRAPDPRAPSQEKRSQGCRTYQVDDKIMSSSKRGICTGLYYGSPVLGVVQRKLFSEDGPISA
ncbi:hypothetical protein VUR80DRAFT_9928 [Thermomyces stellatus]